MREAEDRLAEDSAIEEQEAARAQQQLDEMREEKVLSIWGPIVRGGEWPAQAWIILLALTTLAAIYYYSRRNRK